MLHRKYWVLVGSLALAAGAHADPLVTYDYLGAALVDVPAPSGCNCDPYGPEVVGTATFDASVVTSAFTGEAPPTASTLGTAGEAVTAVTLGSEFQFVNGQIVGWFQQSQYNYGPYLVFVRSDSVNGDDVYPFQVFSGLGSASTAEIGAWTRVTPVPEPAAGALLLTGLLSLAAWRRRKG